MVNAEPPVRLMVNNTENQVFNKKINPVHFCTFTFYSLTTKQLTDNG